MDKNEFTMKLEEIDVLAERGDFEGAAAAADTVDWRKVKNLRTLCTVAEIYEACRRYDDSLTILQIAYKKSGNSKSVVYRLAEMYIRIGKFDEAERYIREYKQLSPHDMSRYILLYKLACAKKVPLDDQIAILRTYKDREYTERWAYELARLYHQNGQDERCVSECDDMILWFAQGKYVLRAMDLKRQIKPLTKEQEALYNKEKERVRMEAEAAEAARLAKIRQEEEAARTRELKEKEEAEAKARALEKQRRREEALREAEELNRVEPGSTLAAIEKLDAVADQAVAVSSVLANAPNVAVPVRQVFQDEPPTEEQEMLASSIREVFADIRGQAGEEEEPQDSDAILDDLLAETNNAFAEELSTGEFRRMDEKPTAEEEEAWAAKEEPKANELAPGKTLAEAVAAALAAEAAIEVGMEMRKDAGALDGADGESEGAAKEPAALEETTDEQPVTTEGMTVELPENLSEEEENLPEKTAEDVEMALNDVQETAEKFAEAPEETNAPSAEAGDEMETLSAAEEMTAEKLVSEEEAADAGEGAGGVLSGVGVAAALGAAGAAAAIAAGAVDVAAGAGSAAVNVAGAAVEAVKDAAGLSMDAATEPSVEGTASVDRDSEAFEEAEGFTAEREIPKAESFAEGTGVAAMAAAGTMAGAEELVFEPVAGLDEAEDALDVESLIFEPVEETTTAAEAAAQEASEETDAPAAEEAAVGADELTAEKAAAETDGSVVEETAAAGADELAAEDTTAAEADGPTAEEAAAAEAEETAAEEVATAGTDGPAAEKSAEEAANELHAVEAALAGTDEPATEKVASAEADGSAAEETAVEAANELYAVEAALEGTNEPNAATSAKRQASTDSEELSWMSWETVGTEEVTEDGFDFSTWVPVDFLGGSATGAAEAIPALADIPAEAAETAAPVEVMAGEAAETATPVEVMAGEAAETVAPVEVMAGEAAETAAFAEAVPASVDIPTEDSQEKNTSGIGAVIAAAGVLVGGAAAAGGILSGTARTAGAPASDLAGAEELPFTFFGSAGKSLEAMETPTAPVRDLDERNIFGRSETEEEATADAVGIEEGLAGLALTASVAAVTETELADAEEETPAGAAGSKDGFAETLEKAGTDAADIEAEPVKTAEEPAVAADGIEAGLSEMVEEAAVAAAATEAGLTETAEKPAVAADETEAGLVETAEEPDAAAAAIEEGLAETAEGADAADAAIEEGLAERGVEEHTVAAAGIEAGLTESAEEADAAAAESSSENASGIDSSDIAKAGIGVALAGVVGVAGVGAVLAGSAVKAGAEAVFAGSAAETGAEAALAGSIAEAGAEAALAGSAGEVEAENGSDGSVKEAGAEAALAGTAGEVEAGNGSDGSVKEAGAEAALADTTAEASAGAALVGVATGAAAAAAGAVGEAVAEGAAEGPKPELDILAMNGFEFVEFTDAEATDHQKDEAPNTNAKTEDDKAFVEEMMGVEKRPVGPRPLDATETELLSYFSRIPGVPEQVTTAMADVFNHSGERTSNCGNVLIMGRPGCGKSRLAEAMILAMGRDLGIQAVKSARLTAQEMNQKDAATVIGKMAGGFLVIEAAGSLRDDVVENMSGAMEFRTDGLVIILEDERKELKKMLARHPIFAKKFTSEVVVPVFTNDELVMFAKTYAKERGYKLDEMAVLALYTEIGENQRDEEPVTVGMVRMMIDRAINRTASHRFGRRRAIDTDGRILLREKDFDY